MNGRTNVERELKLQVPPGFSLARLPQHLKNYVASPAQFLRLHTVYYDTDDLRLLRWGCSLRFRRSEGWTLKLPVLDTSGGTLTRTEHVFPGDLDRVPAEALDLATAFLRGAPVRRVAELRTVRVKRDFERDGERIAEVVEDDVRVVDGTRVAQRFAQLEIELTNGGTADALDSIAEVLQSEGAGQPDPTPKNERAIETDGAPEIPLPQLPADATIGDVVRSALGSALVQFIRCDPLLRTTDDVEAVHKARVAVRKLRSHLHTFEPVLDETWARELRERLRWLQDGLAPVRDADVFAARMHELSRSLPHADLEYAAALLQRLDERRHREREALRSRLRDPYYPAMLGALVDAARAPRFRDTDSAPASTSMALVMQRAFKNTRKSVRKAGPQPSDRALHRIRIKGKHLRYAAEAFACVAGRPATRYAACVEQLQEALGLQHDGVVAVARLRSFDVEGPARFAAGELAMLASRDGADACKTWRKIWRRAAKKRNRFW